VAKPRNADEERAVDLDHLEPDLKSKALDLGFRKRASVNKIVRTLEHEKKGHKLSVGFVIVMGVAAVVSLVLRFFLPEERKGHFLLIGLFAGAWSFLAWLYAKRSSRRGKEAEELLAVVKAKLGK
jgi:hypothetical protein